MGNGISRTYPVGVLKTQPKAVQFGNPEVRTYDQDQWITRPLLNTHETARLEAKIRAMPMQPAPVKPQPPKPKGLTENQMGAMVIVGAATVVVTAVVCGLAGPFGLLVPAGLLLVACAVKALKPKKTTLSPEKRQAIINTIKHLEKTTRKYEAAGLREQAILYRDMARQLRKRHKL